MTIKALYPNSFPTLDLNFARAKRLDSRITFTRASTGTFVASDGLIKTAASGAARFDHNPVTGESLGLLVEEARTNSLTYSEQLQQYSAANVTVASDVSSTAPGGQLNASKIIPSSTNDAKSLGRAVSFTAATTHVVSFFAKPAGYNFLVIALYVVNNGGDGPSCVLDLVNRTLTVSNSSAGYSFAIVRSEPMQNGWTRFALSFSNNVDTGPELRFCPAPNGTPSIQTSTGSDHGRPTFAGDGTSGVLLWGLQCEVGSFPTSYIPTTSTTVTRAADVASITGANFSSWYSQNQGTMLGITSSQKTAGRIWEINDNSFNSNRLLSAVTSTGCQFVAGVPAQTFWNVSLAASTLKVKSILSYQSGSYLGAADGSFSTPSTDSRVPLVTQMWIGGPQDNGSGASYPNATIARLAYWPSRLPDAQLIALTQ